MSFNDLMECFGMRCFVNDGPCHPDAIAVEVERVFGPRWKLHPAWDEFDAMVSGEGNTCHV